MKPRPTSAIGTVQRWNEPDAIPENARPCAFGARPTMPPSCSVACCGQSAGTQSPSLASQRSRQQAVYVPRRDIGLVPGRIAYVDAGAILHAGDDEAVQPFRCLDAIVECARPVQPDAGRAGWRGCGRLGGARNEQGPCCGCPGKRGASRVRGWRRLGVTAGAKIPHSSGRVVRLRRSKNPAAGGLSRRATGAGG